MSRGKKLFLMVIALVVMVGLYYFFSNKPVNKHNEEIEQEHTQKEDIESIVLNAFENNEIERLLLKKKDENILLINGETPTIEGLGDVQLNMVTLYHIFNSFANLTVDQLVVKNTEDLAQYGLDKPHVSVVADIKEKDPVSLHIGNKTVDGRNYYVRLDEEKTVYLIQSSVGNYFMADIADLRDATLPNIDPRFIRYLYIEARGNKPIEIAYKTDIDTKKTVYGIGLYSLIQPYDTPKEINYLKFDEIIKGLPKFKAEKFIDDKPVDLSIYGLDNPILKLKLKSKNEETNISKEADILFGDTFDGDYVYFKYADTDTIYGMRNDFMDPLLKVTPFDIVDKSIYIVNIKDIKELEVSMNNSSYTFEIKHNTTKDEEKAEQAFMYKEKELGEEDFRALYRLIIGISADAEVNQVHEAIGNEVLKIIYTFNDNTTKTITYMSYSDLFYFYQMEDNVYFLSSSKQVDAIKDKIENIIKE